MSTRQKLRQYFRSMIVLKNPQRSQSFSALSIPSYMRDWLVMRYAGEDGQFNMEDILGFMTERLPQRDQWPAILHRLVHEHTEVTILAKVQTQIDVTNQETYFSLPDYSFPTRKAEAIIDNYVLKKHGEKALAKAVDIWGVVTMECRADNSGKNRVYMVDYDEFCPYDIDLNYYRSARSHFSVEEWLDVVLSAVDLNPDGYVTLRQKLATLSRLLPFVEKRINLIELAPKGTGKSYVYSRISKYGWLASGSMTRAKLFYNIAAKQDGLLARCDYVAFDEISSFQFSDEAEMQASLKGYLESGEYKVGSYAGVADAGLILLGNIDQDCMDEEIDMFDTLPGMFHSDSALLDRFHGFIKGWDIPRMRDDMIANDWALNVEYFSEIMHALRNEASYRAIVEDLIDVPKGSDVRDTEAVKRIATGFMKLIFPNAMYANDLPREDFYKYCFLPAYEMRGTMKKQMGIIDKEFRHKGMPELKVVDYEKSTSETM